MDLTTAKSIAEAFAKQYYQTFDASRANLGNLYVDVSILSFEGDTQVGKQKITEKLVSLPFVSVQHVVTTADGQPTVDGGVVVHVLGQLKTDNDPPHAFSETFYLKQGEASWVIANQLFRLSVHHG